MVAADYLAPGAVIDNLEGAPGARRRARVVPDVALASLLLAVAVVVELDDGAVGAADSESDDGEGLEHHHLDNGDVFDYKNQSGIFWGSWLRDLIVW